MHVSSRTALSAAVAVAAGTLAGACGGDDGGGSEQPAEPRQAPEEQSGSAAASSAKRIFGENCGSCHTLADANASGAVGPNLDELELDAARVEEQVRNGGGGMPAFEGKLSDEQIGAVAEYVAEKAGR
jgi:mono/diheme cytochrome c family protein